MAIAITCIWSCVLIAWGWSERGLAAFPLLGIQVFLPGFPGAFQIWQGIGLVALWGASTGVLLFGLRKVIPSLAKIPRLGYFLMFWLPGAGFWLSVYRLLFADPEVDLIACWEPFLVAAGTVLLPAATGALAARIPALWKRNPLVQPSSFCEALLAFTLLGVVVLAFALEMLALGGLWIPRVLWFFSIALMVIGLPWLIHGLGKPVAEREPSESWSKQKYLLLGVILLVVQAAFLLACLPPDDSDELRYHLTIPKRYLEHQGWCSIEGQTFSFFPLGAEMLFSLPLSLDWLRPEGARMGLAGGGKIVHLWFFVLILMLLSEWSRQRLHFDLIGRDAQRDDSHSLWGAWLYGTIPFSAVLGSWAFVDHAVSFGWLSSGYFLWLYMMQGSSNHLYLASIALGWSLMVKYTSLAWSALFFLAAFPLLTVSRRSKPKAVPGLILIPLLCASPWLVHNWHQSGNPFFPLLPDLFGSGFTPVQKAFYSWHAGMKGGLNQFDSLSIPGKILDLLTLPVRVVFHPEQFEQNPLGGMLLLLLPLGLLGGVRSLKTPSRGIGLIVFMALSIFLLWALTYRDPRFALPLWGILSMGIGLGLEKEILGFSALSPRAKKAASTAISVILILWGFGQCQELFSRAVQFADGYLLTKPADAYLSRPDRHPIHPTIREAEALRKKEHPVRPLLLLGQEQAYYFDSPVTGHDYFDGPELAELARTTSSLEEMSMHLQDQGIAWIWINRGTLEGNLFNLFRGVLFASDTPFALEWIDRMKKSPIALEALPWKGFYETSPAFRRMQAWLILHPGYEEVPLHTVALEERPMCPFYRDWLSWPELQGTPVTSLPRHKVTLLRAKPNPAGNDVFQD